MVVLAMLIWTLDLIFIFIQCTVLYCTIGDDHRSRGQYDSLWSVLRLDQFDLMHSPLNVCNVCVPYELMCCR